MARFPFPERLRYRIGGTRTSLTHGSSWPALCRPSTTFFLSNADEKQAMDGRRPVAKKNNPWMAGTRPAMTMEDVSTVRRQ
jgi:hypothetical protein